MKIGALIPARVSSKRLPRKNFQNLKGKPLVCWTIDKLLEADVFDRITVSTDCNDAKDQIKSIYPSNEVDAVVRPDNLCSYDTDLNDCIANFLYTNHDIDVVATLLPTFPFRSIATLRNIDYHIRSRYVWKVTGISSERYTTCDFYYPIKSGVKRIFDSRPLQCSIYNGTYTYWHRNYFGNLGRHYPLTYNERHLHVPTTAEECIDIDTKQDFELAKAIMGGGALRPKKCKEHRVGQWVIIAPDGLDIDKFISFIGENKLNDQKHPLLVLKRVQHAFARFLRLTQFVGRSHFVNLDAYKHVHSPEGLVPHQSQTYPIEYRAVPAYRLLRIPDKKYAFSTQNTMPDIHGVDLDDMFGNRNSTEHLVLPSGTQLAPDTVPFDRIVKWEDLIEQEFFITPYEIVNKT